MSIKETVNDIHALTAAAIKLGADQEQDRIIGLVSDQCLCPSTEHNDDQCNKWLIDLIRGLE
jgi:hypothetical protein